MRKALAALFILGLLLFSFLQFYHFLKNRIVAADLKQVTEKRISAFLKAPVRIDKISVGLLRHISLSGLEITRAQKGYPVLVGVKKMVVRYDLAHFLTRNFRIPTEIFLDAPRLTVQALQSPESLFNWDLLRSDRGILTRFEFEEGDAELPWFRAGESLHLTAIEGQAVPKRRNRFDVRFRSRLSGALSGTLLAYGEVNPATKDYHFEMTLENASFSETSQIPVTRLGGTFEFQNDVIRIRKFHFLLRGIPCELSGEIRNVFSEKPVFALTLRIQDKKLSIRSDIRADFEQGTLAGDIRFYDRAYEFSGLLRGEPVNFQISELLVNHLYRASGQFDIREGRSRIEAEHGSTRLRLDFSMADFHWELLLRLDHFNLFGFDLVTYATLNFAPYEEAWQKGIHAFDFQIKTDYLIFQHEPLRDFKASGRLSEDGLDGLVANWGQASELRGKLWFGRIPKANLTLRAGPIHLNELHSLGAHPLSSTLDGIFEGKLAIGGPLENPDLNGAFTIEHGRAGGLKYDRAIVNFSGHLPYLVLNDSKVLKGKNSFMLTGGFDFTLPNFLEGIQVHNSERVVIWKGLELTSELEDLSSISSRRHLRSSSGDTSRMDAAYEFGERTSLHVTAEEEQAKKEYLTVGPKVKF